MKRAPLHQKLLTAQYRNPESRAVRFALWVALWRRYDLPRLRYRLAAALHLTPTLF